MLNRKIQNVIKEYFTSNSNKILIIDGARQIGKSFIIRHEGQIQFPNYIEVNLLEDKMGERIFANVTSTVDFYMRLSSVAGDKMGDKYDTLVFTSSRSVWGVETPRMGENGRIAPLIWEKMNGWWFFTKISKIHFL